MSEQERNKNKMKLFEKCINTADEKLAEELIDSKASFLTPASPKLLYGGKGYLSVVYYMRKDFSYINWKIEEMIAEKNIVVVRWICSGTHDGEFTIEGMIGILRAIGILK